MRRNFYAGIPEVSTAGNLPRACCIVQIGWTLSFSTVLLLICMLTGCGSPHAETSMAEPASEQSESVADRTTTENLSVTDAANQEMIVKPEPEPVGEAKPVEGRRAKTLPSVTSADRAPMAEPLVTPAPKPSSAAISQPHRNAMKRRARSSAQYQDHRSGASAKVNQSWGTTKSEAAAKGFTINSNAPTVESKAVAQSSTPPLNRETAENQSTKVKEPIAAAESFSIPDSQLAPEASPEKKQPATVEVFYATDRLRIAAVSKGDLWKVFGWSLQLGLLGLITGFIGGRYQRQGVKLIAAVACIGCLVLGYGGWIEWQQRTRLKDDGDVWYTHDIKIASSDAQAFLSADGQPDPLDYGVCEVSIPPNHQIGLVEAPSITRFELTEDPEKHVVLKRITRSDSHNFFHQLNERLTNGSDEALIFIHGYNVSFNNAVKRTAQISHDVEFQGTPICYSWPSRGGLEDYTRDMANADWSVVHLQDFLTSLFEESDAQKIHLIAHSMGNRVLMQALDRLALRGQTDTRFGQIVLAAPDVSANDFRQRYSNVIRKMSDHVTLYASSRDRALMVSASVHGHDRAGLAGDGIVVVDGIDTIDVSHVDTSLIGHSYYGDNPELIDDLAAIILQAKPTTSRSWLRRIDTAANRFYWKFR